ncbi:penicillin-binding protein 2 [Poseidonibacter lekithochrous]|uniref:penicillin-binding protein 2 n=1 Tax=Poseidonibacter lekithochrous TaxID=1904463 RepID=UPI0008FC3828|nr:penicillin-binding protein 2 [Poseidonibacter lekithochrous]QKJ23405.1 penicillin-binding protein 2 [Poseidonibacter lekithochrous]
MKIRLNFIFIFILVIMVTLLARVYFLSIKSNTYYEELSKQNYISRINKMPIRGIIEDRKGRKLAVNEMGFSILIKPHLRSYKRKQQLIDATDFINKHFPKLKQKKLIKNYRKKDSPYNHDFVKVVDYIPYDEFFSKYTLFASQDNIKVESAVKRFYPYNKTASHIIGYVGKASKLDILKNKLSSYNGIIGKNGLEKYYNQKLQGEMGYKDVKVNALNKEIEVLNVKEPSSNNDIKISLDIELQKFIQENFKEKGGAVIVMNAKTGELLSAASFPEFDNNIFARGISVKEWDIMRNDFNHPFTNKLINGLYPPGSIIKMGVGLSFLENGIEENYTVNDSGFIKIGNRNFRCWKHGGHGIVGFRKAIRESCDDFFYKGSLRIGINKISTTLDQFGFGQLTGIDQVNEFVGVNPNKQWKQRRYKQPWYVGETVITSIGQGNMLVTPMQMARYTAYLATGKIPKPYFNEENYEEPKELNFPKKHLDIMRKGMYDVTHHKKGTATHYIKSKVEIAGKTGTAQVVSIPQTEKVRMKESELKYYQRSHAWLTTYGPYKNPQYVVTALVEHGGHGGSAAGGMVSKIYDKLYELGYIKDPK